jgi:chromosome partitioning protein
MRAVAFQNQKGGVGKSTLSLLVAERLAQMGRQVIFLDNDPQGNSTQWFLNRLTDAHYPLILEELQTKNLYNLLQERISPKNALLELPETTLKLLAATPNYEQAKTAFRNQPGHENLFRMLLKDLKTEALVCDTPGEFSLLTNWSLSLCDTIVIPVQTEMFAVETLPIQLERIRTARSYLNPELRQVYLLPNLFDTRLKSCHYALDFLVDHYRNILIFHEDYQPLWIPKRAEIMGFIDSHEPVRSPEMNNRLQVLAQALFPEFT